jgi:hypothetical protein
MKVRQRGAPAEYTHDVVEEIERRLNALGPEAVEDLMKMWTPEQAAAAMLQPLPAARVKSPVNDVIGPFFTTSSLMALRGVTRAAISLSAAKGDILRLWTSDGQPVYPAFQFGPHGELLPGLRFVVGELAHGHEDAWLWAQWLNGASPGGDQAVPVTIAERLRDGDRSGVIELARLTAAAWAA